MADELLELARLRADLPPADEAAMARARATLVHTATSAPARRRWFTSRKIATALGATAAVAAFVLVPGASDNAPTASAVTFNDDGTVTIQVSDLLDIPAANEMLKNKGVHAELVGLQPENSCTPDTKPGDPLPMPDGLVVAEKWPEYMLTFRPDLIPADTTLLMLAVLYEGHPGLVRLDPVQGGHAIVPAELHPPGAGTCVDDPFAFTP